MRRIRRSQNPRLAAREAQLEQRAEERIASLHAPPPPPSDSPPMLPRDITELDDRALMALFGELTAWASHYAGQLAEAEAREELAESVLDVRRAQAAVGTKAKSVTATKALIEADTEVREAREAYLDARAERKRHQVAYENANRCAAYVSRELSRRIARADRDARVDKWLP